MFPSNAWIKDRALKVYLRKGKRLFVVNKKCKGPTTIDLGALELHPRFVGRLTGAMQILQMVRRIETVCAKHGWALYVENLYTPALWGFFERRGYTLGKDERRASLMADPPRHYWKIFG